jgi:hypothetical protein
MPSAWQSSSGTNVLNRIQTWPVHLGGTTRLDQQDADVIILKGFSSECHRQIHNCFFSQTKTFTLLGSKVLQVPITALFGIEHIGIKVGAVITFLHKNLQGMG